jgi:hypothetical protein
MNTTKSIINKKLTTNNKQKLTTNNKQKLTTNNETYDSSLHDLVYDGIFDDILKETNDVPEITDKKYNTYTRMPRYIHQHVEINKLNDILYNEITHDNLKEVIRLLHNKWSNLQSILSNDNYHIVSCHMNEIAKVYNKIVEPFNK